MNAARVAGVVLAVVATAGCWLIFDHLSILRGTFWWEIRYIAVLVAVVLLLSVMEALAQWIDRRFAPPSAAAPSDHSAQH
ncbi:MAG: hypothetical protein AAGF45_01900 [Pseudomonadota bacterium]